MQRDCDIGEFRQSVKLSHRSCNLHPIANGHIDRRGAAIKNEEPLRGEGVAIGIPVLFLNKEPVEIAVDPGSVLEVTHYYRFNSDGLALQGASIPITLNFVDFDESHTIVVLNCAISSCCGDNGTATWVGESDDNAFAWFRIKNSFKGIHPQPVLH